jgi:hypothetical protein
MIQEETDVVAIIIANNGEESRVKFLDTGPPPKSPNPTALTPSITSARTNGGIVEDMATFPDVTVTVGAEHKACVITTKSLDLTCTTGNNLPAERSEFVDISLNVTNGAEESIIIEESEAEQE